MRIKCANMTKKKPSIFKLSVELTKICSCVITAINKIKKPKIKASMLNTHYSRSVSKEAFMIFAEPA